MTGDRSSPEAFDVYTVVLLRRPADAPRLPEAELDELQARHLEYRAALQREGVVVVRGPFAEQSDIALRGLSIFACGLEEARRLSDADPLVQAGRLVSEVMEWWVEAGTMAFPEADRPVGERRTMDDE